MDKDIFKSWLDSYANAYEKKNLQTFTKLFTHDAEFYTNPFTEPLYGCSALIDYFSNVLSSQEQIHFSYEILSVSQEMGIAHWWLSFIQVSTKSKVKLDGILVAIFDNSLCKVLKQWWHWLEYSF